MNRKILKVLKVSLFLFILWFSIHHLIVLYDGFNDDYIQVDAAVVLGNKVEIDGKPSKRLQARLDKAVELYEEGLFDLIIVSGGIGVEGFDEAEVMKEYLMGQGIDAENILVDSNGYNTGMTAENTRQVAEQYGIKSVMVITQYFHISRTKLAFKKEGFSEVYGAHAEIFELRDFYSIIREFPAFYKYLFS